MTVGTARLKSQKLISQVSLYLSAKTGAWGTAQVRATRAKSAKRTFMCGLRVATLRQKQLYDLNEMTLYSAVPAKDKLTCFKQLALGGPNYLPNLEWKYVQDVEFRGIKCHKYAFTRDTAEKFIAAELYTKVGSQQPVAVGLPKVMIHIYKYTPNQCNSSAFDVPAICQDADQSKPTVLPEYMSNMEDALSANIAHIEKMNGLSDHPDAMRLGLNAFAHMSFSEFAAERLQPLDLENIPVGRRHRSPTQTEIDSLPKEVDWTREGMVTRVKNQAGCGSCWSFASIATLETQYARKHNGKKVEMSEQNLMDCAWGNYSNNGCWGGLPPRAFQYILDEQKGKLVYEYAYPYEMENGFCHFNPRKYIVPDFQMKEWYQVDEGDYHALEDAVAKHGSVAVGIAATSNFQLYTGGLFTDPDCDPTMMNHAVTIVGYGTTASGNKYWKVKNSWGTNWGVNGYFYIPRGVNQCGIENLPAYPTVY
eukprot:gnl/Trimastix_PCT/73.p2 GENE.gnl/Trimastix_PCT/73~~gnl/Trimastix_PCT/73.p2  ORF type:complete len:478 (+),score=138.90 gnl/Trimastix_PCT/73:121-1554(+)